MMKSLKVVANLVFQPRLLESSKLFKRLPLNNLFRFLIEEYGMIIPDSTRLEIIKKLLQSKKHPLNNKLSSGWLAYQREVGITIDETNSDGETIYKVHLIASPTGALQCMIQERS